ncbi:hypothetical protein [Streptomyces chattanoogensis]|uniref:MmyB family transcriptional regulator n=1 Tax=Streptomyces chattanoogensis TaxID=66876 RepID=UPI0012FEBBA5|nr:hypothetical protein [Streptomyces chattanoogensis]
MSANITEPSRDHSTATSVDQQLRQLFDGMHDIPAMISGRRQDLLAWNTAAIVVLTDFGALPPAARPHRSRSAVGREVVTEHRQAAGGLGVGRLIL